MDDLDDILFDFLVLLLAAMLIEAFRQRFVRRYRVNLYLLGRSARNLGRYSNDVSFFSLCYIIDCSLMSVWFVYFQFVDLVEFFPEFKANFAMAPDFYEWIFTQIESDLLPKKISRNDVITPRISFALFMQYVCSGASANYVHSDYRVSKRSFYRFIKSVSTAIRKNLSQRAFPVLQHQDWLNNANDFMRYCCLPNCVGAMDGKHVAIRKPNNSGSTYFNYLKYFSIVLFAVCDARKRFIYVHAGSMGSMHDSYIFRYSSLGQSIQHNQINLPADQPIGGVPCPLFFIVDDAFSLHHRLVKAFSTNHALSPEQRVFNAKITSARKVIEDAFGILSSRFRIFHSVQQSTPGTTKDIVIACCIIHNLLIDQNIHQHVGPRYTGIPVNWRDIPIPNIQNMVWIPAFNANRGSFIRSLLQKFYSSPETADWF